MPRHLTDPDAQRLLGRFLQDSGRAGGKSTLAPPRSSHRRTATRGDDVSIPWPGGVHFAKYSDENQRRCRLGRCIFWLTGHSRFAVSSRNPSKKAAGEENRIHASHRRASASQLRVMNHRRCSNIRRESCPWTRLVFPPAAYLPSVTPPPIESPGSFRIGCSPGGPAADMVARDYPGERLAIFGRQWLPPPCC